MSGFVRPARDLGPNAVETCDVCIIGSGAGGAVLAARLTAAGKDVVMIEEGGWHTRRDFTLREGEAYPMLYQDGGSRATADLAITVMQGRSAGGSTTVNWTTCFRTPKRILDAWGEQHGIVGLDEGSLRPHFEAIEARLNIAPWPEAQANANNRALLDGARALGWEATPLRRNVKGCANSGYCSMGCPVDGKQAMHVTFLPDALTAGLRLYTDLRALRLVSAGGKVVAVEAQGMVPQSAHFTEKTLRVEAKVFALCGGAINNPALLLRSDLNPNGRVGRRTFLHPVVAVVGRYPHPVEAYKGAPQSIGSHQFIDRGPDKIGFFLESAPVHPMLATLAVSDYGARLGAFLPELPHIGALLGLHVDGLLPGDEGGVVSLRDDGRIRLDYPVLPALCEAMAASHKALAAVTLAAGATYARTGHVDPIVLRSVADLPLLDAAPYGAHQHGIFSAHQMGGCAMGASPETSVVGPDHKHHHRDNLYIVDGSVLPTALGVNPSETIYGLSHRAAEGLLAAL